MIRPLTAIAVMTLIGVAALSGCQAERSAPQDVGAQATANMKAPDGSAVGTVTLTQTLHGVLVAADVNGLVAGGHGFHIHTVGTCTPDFAAAGDHFNPGDVVHGYFNAGGVHAGDLPNLYVAADSSARADYFTAAVSLDVDAPHSLFDADGSTVIIHEKPDTYGEDAGAGGRVACGVIERN